MKILGIESSCDETACSVVQDGKTVLSNIVASQIDEHRLYGGVVPEIASRRHAENIGWVTRKALEKAEKGDDRFSHGAALIMRGDIAMKAGNGSNDACKKALIDGYLRVVYLYKDAEIADRLQPEALYKAARCFDKLNQSGRADTMRTELKRTYANSPWANK